MKTIDKKTFQFLKELRANNNREWFTENKPRYQEAHKNVETFLADLIPRMAKFDSDLELLVPKSCMYRIYRDVRFSKNKEPYKPNFGAALCGEGNKWMKGKYNKAGYYLHIESGNSFLAGGAYMPPGPWISEIRKNIAERPKEFKKIIGAATFKKYFGEMEGEKLKTAPRDYLKDHPEIELLRYKSFLAVHKLSDKQVMSEDFMSHAVKVFSALKEFDRFLNC